METDLHLLSRYHRLGDAEAFQALVESHAGMVHATASRVTCDAMLAQDVAQETFLALARSSGSAIRSVGAWLHHVAWQKARDTVRGESRRHRHESAAAQEMQVAQADTTWAELEPLLDEVLEELPLQTKALLIERFFEGRTQQEIAQRHGISQSSVSRTLDHGIAELRLKLKARGIICGGGLAVLLLTHGIQAAPPMLIPTLGKLALSGVGAATATLTFTQTITSVLMTQAAKFTLLTVAAVLAVAVVSNDLASSSSSIRKLFADKSPPTASASEAGSTRLGSAGPHPVRLATASSMSGVNPLPKTSPASLVAAGKTVKGPSPAILATLSTLKTQADFKAFVLTLFASKDPRYISAELKRLMGIDIKESDVATRLVHPNILEVAIMMEMARQLYRASRS